ncbi:hypothetical protein HN832_00895 [archaeon]|jgi:hypothetical protein|nr:hypothetical protein [archaeon]MBT4373768.1 hypothetical protein [archaeon]MBT4532234.1 hypothetical protein [archaeon]MBT7001059.1 hypothetical protein [archaeon]MBT7281948.1 hypothetical protein [archaeon]
MPIQNTNQPKEKIIQTLKTNGPSLPIHISKEIGVNTLFASAFLGELLSNKQIKMSHMKVGNSPIYLLAGQEPQLEKYSQHLKSREKDAFLLLKEKQILEDQKQEPAIRVALRAIKDFAVAFQKEGRVMWRYFTNTEAESIQEKKENISHPTQKEKPQNLPQEKEKPDNQIQTKKISEIPPEKPANQSSSQEENIESHKIPKEIKISQEITTQESLTEKSASAKNLNIFDKKKYIKKTTVKKKKTSTKQNQKFFEKIKHFLSENNTELLDIISFNHQQIILHVKTNENEKILVAYNKKRVNEIDIIDAHKKSAELSLPYAILTKGHQTKKLTEFINAAKSLQKIEIFE